MKKILALLLAAALLLSMAAGCSSQDDPSSEPTMPASTAPSGAPNADSTGFPSAEPSTPADPSTSGEVSAEPSTAPSADPSYDPSDPLYPLLVDFPRTDGSTSTTNLDAAIRARLFGIPLSEAKSQVKHNTTYGSFSNLLGGGCDIIYSTPLSDYQREWAAEQNIALTEVPIGTEAFVFVVNAENPISELTQQQLKDIYSGKITNWSQLGGNDAEIVAYQRNSTSGSQNYMIEFMGDTPLMDFPTEARPGSMEGLMNAVAVYDNAENAIGYSVYSYAAQMYEEQGAIKFIAVDGVKPTLDSMADQTYPLLGYNYAIFRSSEAADSPVRLLADWLLTDEGQLAVSEGGYIPISGGAPEQPGFALYSAIGTGPVRTDESAGSADYFYTVGTGLFSTMVGEKLLSYDVPEGITNEDEFFTGMKYYISNLKDKTVEQKINNWIAAAVSSLEDRADEFIAFAERERIAGNYNFFPSSLRYYDPESYSYRSYTPAVTCETELINGYLSVALAFRYYNSFAGSQESYSASLATEIAIFDLFTGEMLDYSDLFYKNSDFVSDVNEYLHDLNAYPDGWGSYPELQTEFAGLAAGAKFSLTKVYLAYGDPYYGDGFIFDLGYPSENSILREPRDISPLLTDNNLAVRELYQYYSTKSGETYILENNTGFDGTIHIWLIGEDQLAEPARTKINDAIIAYAEELFDPDAVEAALRADDSYPLFEEKSYLNGSFTAQIVGERWVLFGYFGSVWYTDSTGLSHSIDSYDSAANLSRFFDAKTGEPLDLDLLFKPGWRDAGMWTAWTSGSELTIPDSDRPNIDELTLLSISGYADMSSQYFELYFGDIEGYNSVYFKVPRSYFAY